MKPLLFLTLFSPERSRRFALSQLNLGKRDEDPFFPLFNLKGLEEISLATDVSPVLQIKTVSVQGTHKVTLYVYITFGKCASGVRTFMRTGKDATR